MKDLRPIWDDIREFSPGEQITALAELFPTLRGVPGVRPFDGHKLDAWAATAGPPSGARHAARFVLGVFNASHEWECGPCNICLAVGGWDEEHTRAFQRWALRPFLL